MAECVLAQSSAAFDLAEEIDATSRFVLVDDYEIRGGGIIREACPTGRPKSEKVMLRNYKWEPSIIQPERRAEKYSQKASLLTGAKESDRKSLGKDVEARLFEDGRVVYFLGIECALRH